jgi:hypothetical protein
MQPQARCGRPTSDGSEVVIDAKTFRGLDSDVSPKPPPVPPASLGPVTYLHVAGSRS